MLLHIRHCLWVVAVLTVLLWLRGDCVLPHNHNHNHRHHHHTHTHTLEHDASVRASVVDFNLPHCGLHLLLLLLPSF